MMCVSQYQTGPILNPISLPYNPHAPCAKGGHSTGARVEFVDQAPHASVLEQPAVIEKLLREFLA
jgi:hypothetical protein